MLRGGRPDTPRARKVELSRSHQGGLAAMQVFMSYSHVDENLRNELEKHLAALKRQDAITT